jgi:hypothetical protein
MRASLTARDQICCARRLLRSANGPLGWTSRRLAVSSIDLHVSVMGIVLALPVLSFLILWSLISESDAVIVRSPQRKPSASLSRMPVSPKTWNSSRYR